MHMAQHLLLVIVAAPLLWLGAPLLPVIWALPAAWRAALGRLLVPTSPLHRLFHFLTTPVVSAGLYVVVLAAWHVPSLYDAAQGRSVVHDLEHLMFVGAALLYWWPVVHPTGGRRRLSYGAGVFYIAPAVLEGNLIGALVTFAGEPLYETYRRAPRVFGLSALQDQQIGGLMMWVLGGLLLLIPIFALVYLLVGGDDVDSTPRPGVPVAGSVR
jgi:cytochrome c oxidase assembly factor CtaG